MIQQVQPLNAGKQVQRKTSASQALRETDGGQKAGGGKDERREKEVGGRRGGGSGRKKGKSQHTEGCITQCPKIIKVTWEQYKAIK